MRVHVMTTGYAPTQADHIRDAGLCGSCHTLYTIARGPDGKQIGQLPEQMPYLEWLHSDYNGKQTCQQCHMPAWVGPWRLHRSWPVRARASGATPSLAPTF